MNFFHTYIGFSGLAVIAGLTIACLSYMGFDKGGGPESAAGPTIGVIFGLVVASFGVAAWVVVWLLLKI